MPSIFAALFRAHNSIRSSVAAYANRILRHLHAPVFIGTGHEDVEHVIIHGSIWLLVYSDIIGTKDINRESSLFAIDNEFCDDFCQYSAISLYLVAMFQFREKNWIQRTYAPSIKHHHVFRFPEIICDGYLYAKDSSSKKMSLYRKSLWYLFLLVFLYRSESFVPITPRSREQRADHCQPQASFQPSTEEYC